MQNLFKWLIKDIHTRYLSLNNEFIIQEIRKLLNKCNLPENYFKEVSDEINESSSNYKSLDKTCWQDVLDLDEIMK